MAYYISKSDPVYTRIKLQLEKNMKITFASPSKSNARKEEKKKGMAMAKLFALDTKTKQYYILCHFIRNEYVTRM